MDQLIIFSFPDQTKIADAIDALRKFNSDRLYASAIVAKANDGTISVQQITKAGHGGTIVAALLGALAGLPAGPAATAIMAAAGTIIGAGADLTIHDHFTEFASHIAENLAPGGAVIVAEVAEDSAPSLRSTMERAGGTVTRPSPSQQKLETA